MLGEALLQNVPTSAHVEHYAGIAHERARRRAIMVAAAEIGDAAASCSAPLDPTKICADGWIVGSSTNAPGVTWTKAPSRTTEYNSDPHAF